MKLSEEDVELFYKLYHALLVYVNKKLNVVRGIKSPRDLKKLPIEKINKIRNRLYKHPELIDSFVAENPLNFSSDELKIISSWKNFVKGEFIILRYLKRYTIFLAVDAPPKAYGVLALDTPFQDIFGPDIPIMVEAVLLPFKGDITYDGILLSYPIIFGGSFRRSLNDAYQEAKLKFGIITSLPFAPKEVERSDAEKLKFYLRSKRNREIYREEINELIKKDPSLLMLYHQEMGKVHARTYRKRLREIGVVDGWFAILEGMIIASGPTKESVEQILQHILPAEKRKFVYIFQMKRK